MSGTLMSEEILFKKFHVVYQMTRHLAAEGEAVLEAERRRLRQRRVDDLRPVLLARSDGVQRAVPAVAAAVWNPTFQDAVVQPCPVSGGVWQQGCAANSLARAALQMRCKASVSKRPHRRPVAWSKVTAWR